MFASLSGVAVGWRRCVLRRRLAVGELSRDGNAMSLRVHALRVGDIVALLHDVCGGFTRARAGERAEQQAYTCTYGSAACAIDGCARCGAEDRAERCAAYAAVIRDLAGSGAAHLTGRVLLARRIIRAKLIEAFAATGQHQHTRAVRQGDAAGEQQRGKCQDARQGNGWNFHAAIYCGGAGGGGCEGTRCHWLGHVLTYG